MPEEYPNNIIDRKADNIAAGSGDGTNQETAFPLDTVGPGFIQGFPRADIGPEDIVRKGVEGDLRDNRGYLFNTPLLRDNSKAGNHLMGLSLEDFECGQGVVTVTGFAKNIPVQGDDGVGPEDTGFGMAKSNLLSLGRSHPPGKMGGGFVGLRGFINDRRQCLIVQTELGEKFLSPWRGGSKDERAAGSEHVSIRTYE